jgi:predicted nucleotidyltransferase
MREIESLDALDIPVSYRAYISKYLHNISAIPFISRVMLFGSCAKECVKKYSDIDMFITTSREITEDEEALLTFHSIPEYSKDTVPTDIIVQTESDFSNHASSIGMVQRQVIKEGVDLSGLLHQRTRD